MRHVVSFSGGKTSFAAAARVVEMYGRDAVTLVFADTLIEDGDLYRFLRQQINGTLHYITLREWREQMDQNPDMAPEPAGGCGCFIDD